MLFGANKSVFTGNCKSFPNSIGNDWPLHMLLVFRLRLLGWTIFCDFCVTGDKWKEHKCAVEPSFFGPNVNCK